MHYTAILTAKAPISHGMFSDASAGNTQMFRREPLFTADALLRVPVISGNSIRGVLRRLIMSEMFGTALVSRESLAAHDGMSMAAWDRLYAALAQGGTIEKMEQTTHPDELRKLRQMLPPLSLFGSAMYGFLLSGVVRIGFAWPITKETAEVLGCESNGAPSLGDILTDVGLVRHIDREEADPSYSGVSPMPYTVESVVSGTKFRLRYSFEPHATELERSCFAHALSLLTHIGGKAAVGFGEVQVTTDSTVGPELYRAWLRNTDAIHEALTDLAATLSGSKPSPKAAA